jgi:hypothetical protein
MIIHGGIYLKMTKKIKKCKCGYCQAECDEEEMIIMTDHETLVEFQICKDCFDISNEVNEW